VAVSVIGGGNRGIRRKPPTCHKSFRNFKLIGDILIINKCIEAGGILTGTYRFFDILYGFNDTTTLFVFIHG
jgi:hypothetical protein